MIITLLGLISGLLLGLTGGGGAIITVPALIYGVKLPVIIATTISLFVVGSSALIGSVLRRKEVKFFDAITFAFFGSLSAPLGIYCGKFFPEPALLISFAVLMLIIAFIMFRKSLKTPLLSIVTKESLVKFDPKIIPISLITGFLTGVFGVGGGFLIVPALILFKKLDNKSAVATSLFIIFLISTSSIISKIKTVELDYALVAIFSIGSIIGMFVGSWLAKKINARTTQQLFSIVAALVGLWMLVDNIMKLIK